MQTNRALRLHAYGDPDGLSVDPIATPSPGEGQVLVRVKAAGVNGIDWKIWQGWVRDAFPLPLPAALGIELAGEVAQVGPGAGRLNVGDRVMGALGGLGAYADFAAVDEAKLSRTPDALTDVQAAAVPVASLAAWQVLGAAGGLRPGQKVLIHGASGGVGGFAVQFAKAAGAEVFATASAPKLDYVLGLGADKVIDRHAQRFEDEASGVDLVLDFVGGDAVERSWRVLSPTGVMVSTATPDIEARAPAGRRGLWFRMQPDRDRLSRIAEAVAAGELRAPVSETTGFSGLPAAIERNWTGHGVGKIVLDLAL